MRQLLHAFLGMGREVTEIAKDKKSHTSRKNGRNHQGRAHNRLKPPRTIIPATTAPSVRSLGPAELFFPEVGEWVPLLAAVLVPLASDDRLAFPALDPVSVDVFDDDVEFEPVLVNTWSTIFPSSILPILQRGPKTHMHYSILERNIHPQYFCTDLIRTDKRS